MFLYIHCTTSKDVLSLEQIQPVSLKPPYNRRWGTHLSFIPLVPFNSGQHRQGVLMEVATYEQFDLRPEISRVGPTTP